MHHGILEITIFIRTYKWNRGSTIMSILRRSSSLTPPTWLVVRLTDSNELNLTNSYSVNEIKMKNEAYIISMDLFFSKNLIIHTKRSVWML